MQRLQWRESRAVSPQMLRENKSQTQVMSHRSMSFKWKQTKKEYEVVARQYSNTPEARFQLEAIIPSISLTLDPTPCIWEVTEGLGHDFYL